MSIFLSSTKRFILLFGYKQDNCLTLLCIYYHRIHKHQFILLHLLKNTTDATYFLILPFSKCKIHIEHCFKHIIWFHAFYSTVSKCCIVLFMITGTVKLKNKSFTVQIMQKIMLIMYLNVKDDVNLYKIKLHSMAKLSRYWKTYSKK